MLCPRADTNGSLVNVEVGPNTVAGTMAVIKAIPLMGTVSECSTWTEKSVASRGIPKGAVGQDSPEHTPLFL